MSISIDAERLVTFAQAAKCLPDDRRPSYTTWWRWSSRGCGGVRLETIVRGGRRLTSVEAVQRFFDALTARSDDRGDKPIRTPSQRERDNAAAESVLSDAGILDGVKE